MKWARRILAAAIVAIVLGYVGHTLLAGADDLGELSLRFRPSYVVLSVISLVAGYAVLPWVWAILCRAFAVRITVADAAVILFISGPARYLPGRILTLVSQVALARERQVPAEVSVATAVLFVGMSSLIGVQVFLISAIVWPGVEPRWKAVGALIGGILLLISIRTAWWTRLVRRFLERWRGNRAPLRFSGRDSLRVQGLLAMSWLGYGVGMHLLLNSFGIFSLAESVWVTGVLAASWLIGYYSFLSPGGIGVREGAQILLLSPGFPAPIAAAIPLLLRVWLTVADLLLFGAGILLRIRHPGGGHRGTDDP